MSSFVGLKRLIKWGFSGLKHLGFMAFFFSLLITSGQAARTPAFPFVGEVTADKVHIRAGQSANFESLGRLHKGELVRVEGKQYSWYKVVLPDFANHYISAAFVELLEPDKGRVTGSRVNVRARMDGRATVLGQVRKGDELRIYETQGEWLRIAPIYDSYGWVLEEFLTFKSKNLSLVETKVMAPAPDSIMVELETQVKDLAKVEGPFVVKGKAAEPTPPATEALLALRTTNQIEENDVTVVQPVPTPVLPQKVMTKALVSLPNVEKEIVSVQQRSQQKIVASVPQESPEGSVALTGIIAIEKGTEFSHPQYNLMIDDQPAYRIQGLKGLFRQFLHYKVSIEGVMEKKLDASTSPYPIIDVSSIQLVL